MEKYNQIAFGQTTERTPEPGTHPDPERILARVESQDSVAREFCTKCGMIAEVTAQFLRERNISPETLGSGDYLETDGCPDCPTAVEEKKGTIRIRNIKEFAS